MKASLSSYSNKNTGSGRKIHAGQKSLKIFCWYKYMSAGSDADLTPREIGEHLQRFGKEARDVTTIVIDTDGLIRLLCMQWTGRFDKERKKNLAADAIVITAVFIFGESQDG